MLGGLAHREPDLDPAATVALQRRRLRSTEPEDKDFILHWFADLQFLIVSLRRLRRSAAIAAHVPLVAAEIRRAATWIR
jgi:hypothetical protein